MPPFQVMNSPPDEPRPDNRRSRRYACVLEAVCRSGEKTTFSPAWPVRVIDISKHGIGIQAGEAIEVGTRLLINVFDASEATYPSLQVCIVREAVPVGNAWVMGAEFLEPLSDEQLDVMTA